MCMVIDQKLIATCSAKIALAHTCSRLSDTLLIRGSVQAIALPPTLSAGGFIWSIGYYPDGISASLPDINYLAFSVNLRSDADKTRVITTLTMLSQTEGLPIKSCKTGTITVSNSGYCYYSNFIKRHEFEASRYLKDDSFTIRCTISVIDRTRLNKTNSKMHPFTVRPTNLHQQLTSLLESGDGTDVSFKVRGVTFDAHRCVLAASSPVFRAEIFGPMKCKMNESIEIKDMEPSIFKSMLNFVYSDSVPELDDDKGNKDASIALAQHLLVAADRYGLERLKELCEMKIYQFIDVNNVATTLTLAEQHNFSELKAVCMELCKSNVGGRGILFLIFSFSVKIIFLC